MTASPRAMNVPEARAVGISREPPTTGVREQLMTPEFASQATTSTRGDSYSRQTEGAKPMNTDDRNPWADIIGPCYRAGSLARELVWSLKQVAAAAAALELLELETDDD